MGSYSYLGSGRLRLIACSCDYGEFFLCLGGNRQVEIDGLAYFMGQRFPLFFRAPREALLLFEAQMNECRRHQAHLHHDFSIAFRWFRLPILCRSSERRCQCFGKHRFLVRKDGAQINHETVVLDPRNHRRRTRTAT